MRQVDKLQHIESIRLPSSLNYSALPGLRKESSQKLQAMRPDNLGQASRISGVTPADINVLMVHLEALKRHTD